MEKPIRPSSGPSSHARRQFLRGAGGFALALPVLPSLLPRGAQAAGAGQPKFVALTSDHGAVWVQDMCPDPSTLTNRMELYPGHNIGSGALKPVVEGANTKLSNILKAPSSLLTDRLVSRMNVLEGFDISFYIAHNSGGHLGNFAANAGNGGPGGQENPTPTIDQIMAWSPSFYRSLDGVRERVIVTGEDNSTSYNYSSPSTKSGSIQGIQPEPDPARLFERVFMGNVPSTPAPPTGVRRPPVVDKVLAEYKALRNGNRRLSASDKQRLDDYIDRLSELQRVVTGAGAPAAAGSCKDVKKPGARAMGMREYFGQLNDVIAAAFMCGSSRIAAVSMSDGGPFMDYRGDFHEAVAHSTWRSAEPMGIMVESYRRMFEWVFLDLAKKLDVDSGTGTSLLDETLIAWTQESGPESHTSWSAPIVTAGSAGGFFKTGLFVDYRNVRPASAAGSGTAFGTPPRKYTGLLQNRWLGTVLQSMGVPRSEYETGTKKGYGHLRIDDEYRRAVVPQVLTDLSDPLPIIKA